MSALTYVIRLHELQGFSGSQRLRMLALSHQNQYVVSYDPFSRDAKKILVTTDDLNEAKTFDSQREAAQYALQSIGTRPDGRPDRPLTAYTIEVSSKAFFEREHG